MIRERRRDREAKRLGVTASSLNLLFPPGAELGIVT